MIIEISVAIIAIAFVALIIYLISLLKTLRITLGQVNQTLVEVRKQLDGLGSQAQKVIEHTNQMSFDLKHQLETLNPIFNAVANLGEVLEHKTLKFKKESLASLEEESYLSDLDCKKKKQPWTYELNKVASFLELGGLGIRLWQKIKKRR